MPVKTCIAHYGPICSICGFDFEKRYGEDGAKFIDVHCINGFAANGELREVNPIDDLRPVCANCHQIIHSRMEPYSIDEMRDKIKNTDYNT